MRVLVIGGTVFLGRAAVEMALAPRISPRCAVARGTPSSTPAASSPSTSAPWDELPLWPMPGLTGLYSMAAGRALQAGLTPRALAETVADTWAWLERGPDLGDWRREVQVTGLAAERERELLGALR